MLSIENNDCQLFLDDNIIEFKSENISRISGEITENNTILTFDKPWEGNISTYYTIFKDHGKMISDQNDNNTKTYDYYRLYYRGGSDKSTDKKTKYVVCYCESLNGKTNWIRPNLNIIDYNGSKNNNILMYNYGGDNFTVFINNNNKINVKYLALNGGKKHKLTLFTSFDGISWINNGPILENYTFDSQNILIWDDNKYKLYFRSYDNLIKRTNRIIMYSESIDLKIWSNPTKLKYNDSEKYEMYTSNILKYYRSQKQFIGLSNRINLMRKGTTKLTGIYDIILLSSNNGLTFNRNHEAWMKPGEYYTKWGSRSGMIGYGIIETTKDAKNCYNNEELSFFVNDGYYQKLCVLKRYTLRIDGFMYMRGNYVSDIKSNYLITKTITFKGNKLFINFRSSGIGFIKIELLDHKNEVLSDYNMNECDEIYGDNTHHLVKWKKKNDVSELTNIPIKIKFYIKDSDLYSFTFIN